MSTNPDRIHPEISPIQQLFRRLVLVVLAGCLVFGAWMWWEVGSSARMENAAKRIPKQVIGKTLAQVERKYGTMDYASSDPHDRGVRITGSFGVFNWDTLVLTVTVSDNLVITQADAYVDYW